MVKSRQKTGRPNTISRQSILDAAMGLLKAEGEAGLSMRKIAKQLEVTPTSLYGYFENKDHLLAALAQQFFNDLELEWGVHSTWQEAIRYWLNHWRSNIQKAPEIMMLAGMLATTPRGLKELENVTQLLLPLTDNEAEAVTEAQSLFWMVLSFCTFEQMASQKNVVQHLQQQMQVQEAEEACMVGEHLAIEDGFDMMWLLTVERNIRGLQRN